MDIEKYKELVSIREKELKGIQSAPIEQRTAWGREREEILLHCLSDLKGLAPEIYGAPILFKKCITGAVCMSGGGCTCGSGGPNRCPYNQQLNIYLNDIPEN